eukprot:4424229-Prymnesium_polylepis.1
MDGSSLAVVPWDEAVHAIDVRGPLGHGRLFDKQDGHAEPRHRRVRESVGPVLRRALTRATQRVVVPREPAVADGGRKVGGHRLPPDVLHTSSSPLDDRLRRAQVGAKAFRVVDLVETNVEHADVAPLPVRFVPVMAHVHLVPVADRQVVPE